MGTTSLTRILVANRGEIAVRIMRTLRRLGISPVAVYSDADRDAPHVALADVAVRIGEAPARDSYLRVDRIVEAARSTGADAIHPGYGFLSERPELVRACDDAGIIFIGPPVHAIEAMADKIAAKQTVSAAGVRVVPGRLDSGMDDAELADAAGEIGFPVLIKPSAGGGGKGMRLVRRAEELPDAISSARREALGSFGDDTLLVERFVERPRHIEIQVLADRHGNVVHLGERECSLQRRHQKIVEEAPSPFITPATRAALGAQAVDAARACGYTGAGTVEFIMSGDRPDEFFFMEMNTRLQVEHPVTEIIHGIDLVEMQIRVAAGEPLPFGQDDLVADGHAVEARIYAEQPARDFVPTGGTVVDVLWPTGLGVRVDAGIRAGTVVSGHYDPMLAKVIAGGRTRAEALDRLGAALGDLAVIGVQTNIRFLRDLLAHPDVRAGDLDTELVERLLPQLVDDASGVPPSAAITAALALVGRTADRSDPWTANVGWRLGGRAWITERLVDTSGANQVVRLRPRPASDVWDVQLDDRPPTTARLDVADRDENAPHRVTVGDVTEQVTVRTGGDTIWVVVDGTPWGFRRHDPISDRLRAIAGSSDHGTIRSPMPGTVVAVVDADATVIAGQRVAVVEAMKMEHDLRAPFDGRVVEVHVRPGQQVALDERLLELTEDGVRDDHDVTQEATSR
jgi:acetyl-CoA/propionyl-CoA carboxylase, biotin carboxylase, biotin carboxyl carrier protein